MTGSPEAHESADAEDAAAADPSNAREAPAASGGSEGRRRATASSALAVLGNRRNRMLLIGIAAAVLVGLVTTILLRTVFAIPVLDSEALTKGVHDVLTKDFRLAGVSDVKCPAEQRIEAGNKFTCQVKIDGQQRSVPIEVTNDAGEYRVNQPR